MIQDRLVPQSRAERLLVVLCGIVAVAAWTVLEAAPGRVTLTFSGFIGAFVASTLLGSLPLPSRQAFTTVRRISRLKRSAPTLSTLGAVSAPGALVWLLPLLVAPAMAIITPIAYRSDPGDHSI